PCSLLLMYPISNLGIIYGAIALYLGSKFLYKAWELKQDPTSNQLAKGMFKYSIFYMMLLCVGMIVDTLPVTHKLMGMIFTCGG
ncbi:MAG: cytochrome c oxidase folding protein, partial [Cyanobacteriota bacterium]